MEGYAALLGVLVSVISLVIAVRNDRRAYSLEQRREHTESELAQAQRELSDAQERLAEAEAAKTRTESHLSTIDTQLRILESVNTNLAEELKRQQEQAGRDIARLERRLTEITAERDRTRQERDALQRDLDSVKAENALLTRRVDELETWHGEAKEKIARLEEVNQRQRLELAAVQQNVDAVTERTNP